MPAKVQNRYKLCLLEDCLEADVSSRSVLPSLNRILYQVEGRTTINHSILIQDNIWFGFGEINLTSNELPSRLWRWELMDQHQTPTSLKGAGLASRLLISEIIESVKLDANWLMRCDSVGFPAGGRAYTHTHRGPGVRCLIEGAIRIDTQNHSEHFTPGEAWFEAGPEPVFAEASEKSHSRFIRVMLVPPEFEGKSTIQYVRDEDLDKPKSQIYRKYCETRLNI